MVNGVATCCYLLSVDNYCVDVFAGSCPVVQLLCFVWLYKVVLFGVSIVVGDGGGGDAIVADSLFPSCSCCCHCLLLFLSVFVAFVGWCQCCC